MKIGLFTDIHGNLPALEKSIERFRNLKCDQIIHLGDLIGIGPYPKECLEFAKTIKELVFIMGNHDYWYCYGLPNPIPKWMNKEEVDHQNWTHNQIGEKFKDEVRRWKFNMELKYTKSNKLTFRHYGLNKEKNWFKPIVKNPTTKDLDNIFEDVTSEIVFYGHHHESSDKQGRIRYVNLGSAGCYDKPESRIGVLELSDNQIKITKESLNYDDTQLMEEFEIRKVPARNFIKKVFMKRN